MSARAVVLACTLALSLPLALWGCQETPAPSAPAPSSPLVPPIRPGGMAPDPAGFPVAEAMYLRGALAFQLGDYEGAAPWLASVAEALKPAALDEPYRAELAKNRVLAYRNATIAWLFAGNVDEARKMLDAARAGDPECEEGLRAIAGMLPAGPP